MNPRAARPTESEVAPEFKLLLLCLQNPNTEKTKEEIRRLATDGVDWQVFFSMARRHGVIPLAYSHLRFSSPNEFPEAILRELQTYARANMARNAILVREIVRLLNLFGTNGIPLVVFKGPVLAAMAHGNLSFRASADIDILIRESDLSKIEKLLLTEGYVLPRAYSFIRHFSNVLTECPFVRTADGLELDVHWQMLPPRTVYAFDSDQVWQRAQFVRLGQTQVPAPSREDSLIFHCAHASKHLWGRLGWICDIAALAMNSAPLDWNEVLRRSAAQDSSRMLLIGLSLARDLMNTKLPAAVGKALQDDPRAEAMAATVRRWLTNDAFDQISRRERIQFHIRMLKRFRNKAAYLYRLFTLPTLADLQLSSSRPMPLPFYYIVRPFRVFAKYTGLCFTKVLCVLSPGRVRQIG